MELRDHPDGGYRFLATSQNAPFSGGVIAMPGYEIVHAVVRRHVPVRDGFALIERHLQSLGRPGTALCAVELRGAVPYTPEEWTAPDGFNERYRMVLREWGLFVGGYPAVARTNVVPVVQPPEEQVLHAFSYTVPLSAAGEAAPRADWVGPVGLVGSAATFVTSGAPEDRALWESDAGVEQRLLSSLDAIGAAVAALGRSWDDVTHLNVYVREGIATSAAQAALRRIGAAARRGLHWYLAQTPLLGPFLECDARSVRREIQIEAA